MTAAAIGLLGLACHHGGTALYNAAAAHDVSISGLRLVFSLVDLRGDGDTEALNANASASFLFRGRMVLP